jgi:hypothetical protein
VQDAQSVLPGHNFLHIIILYLTAATIYSGMPFLKYEKSLYYDAGGKITMNLKAKGYLESQKKVAGDKLAARISSLKAKGLGQTAIQRDSLIKKMKADIRKTNYRLGCIAAQEKLNIDKVQTKAQKLAAKKEAVDKPKAKKLKEAPAKKEKKAKKKEAAPAADEKE